MTQEQKAKAYDEALERMKSWVRGEHPECFTEAQMAAEFIFPELKESEDEKMIREITAFFRKAAGGYLDTSTPCKTYSKWLTWFEKQSELNYSNAIISENEKIKTFLIKTINQVSNDSLLWEEIDKSSVLAWIEKHDEQKSVWSKEDEAMLNHIGEYLCRYGNDIEESNEEKAKEIYKAVDWLKFIKLQNRWKPSDMELETLRLITEKDGTCLKGLYEKLKKLK